MDIDKLTTFPSLFNNKGDRFPNMIVVGASTPDGNIAPFSNYGSKSVDLFAPGYDIVSTLPDNEYARFEGSSLSASIVTGVAAIILSYFPDFTAQQVRDILMESAQDMRGYTTNIPKQPSIEIDFSTLSKSGGILDAHNAIDKILNK